MENFHLVYSLALVLSILINVHSFYRLVCLPYLAKSWPINFRFDSIYNLVNEIIELLITRPDYRLEIILTEVMNKSNEKGFTIKRPNIRVLKKGLGLLSPNGFPSLACASGHLNRILFDEKWLKFDKCFDLRIAMAHELGHVVDYQTKRFGHPLFEKICYVNKEMFADAFTAFLYSKEDVLLFREPEYIKESFNKEEFLNLDLNIESKPIEIKFEDVTTPQITNTA